MFSLSRAAVTKAEDYCAAAFEADNGWKKLLTKKYPVTTYSDSQNIIFNRKRYIIFPYGLESFLIERIIIGL